MALKRRAVGHLAVVAPPVRSLPAEDLLATLRLIGGGLLAKVLKVEAEKGMFNAWAPVDSKAVELSAAHLAEGGDLVGFPHAGDLRRQKLAYEAACEIVMRRCITEHCARAEELYAERKPEWLELQRRRAQRLIDLRADNAAIEALARELTSGGQVADMPGAGYTNRLFGTSRRQGGAYGPTLNAYFSEMVRNGILDERDVK